MKTKFLFPNQFKIIGWILLIPSIILGILMIFFPKINFFELPDSKVFTIYSNGLMGDKNILFGFINGNYTNTIVGILCLMGASLVAFSKEKREDEFITKTRLQSLVWAIHINYAILFFCFLFFFDLEFLDVMVFNMFTILFFFIIRFYYIIYKNNKSLRHEK